jgi:uncharacterized membrane protein
MTVLSNTIEVDRPATEVFAYATDPAKFPEWQKGVVAGSMDKPGPPSVGDRCRMTRRIGLANRTVTSEITHVDAPSSWGLKGVDGPIRAVVDVRVEPLSDARSRLTISIGFEGHGIGRLIVPLMVEREARKEMPRNLGALKAQVETAN